MSFYEEEKKLLSVFLKDTFEQNLWTDYNHEAKRQYYTFPDYGIEFIIRPECNQKCEYCYVMKHGNELYPKETRVDNKTILNNLSVLLDYFINEQKIVFRRIDLFAGDMFYDNLFFDVCEVIYQYYSKLYNEIRNDFEKEVYSIVIPCNCSFVQDDDKVKKFDEYKTKFNDICIDLALSWSSDGYYATETREGKPLEEEYFNKVFRFLKKYGMGAHPMLSPSNVQYGIENYDWWKKKYIEFDFVDLSNLQNAHFMPMILEVRDDGWTDDKIQLYLQYLQHIIEDRFNMCGNNVERFARHLFVDVHKESELKKLKTGDVPQSWTYDPILPLTAPGLEDQDDNISCAMQKTFHVRVSDFAIPICHRLSYNHMLGGWFDYDEKLNKIVGVKPQNVTAYISAKTMKVSYAPKCITCHAQDVCFKGCLGSQYETSGEYAMPIDSVCNLLKARAGYLFRTYCQMGVIKSAFDQDLIHPLNKAKIEKFCKAMGFEIYG